MNSMLTPPPERDLPDQAGMRHRLVLAAQPHRREPDSGRRLVPLAAAAGVALVGGAVMLGATGLFAAGPGVTSGSSGDARPVAGDSVVRQCLHPLPPPSSYPRQPPGPTAARVLAQFDDVAGSMIVVGRLGPTGGVATCDLDPAGHAVAANLPAVQPYLQPWARFDPARQPIVIDIASSQVAVVGDRTSGPGLPGIHAVAGQVTRDAARVVATWSDGHHVDAVVHDGVYAAREVVPLQGANLDTLYVSVQAFDARGRLLGTARGSGFAPATGTPTTPIVSTSTGG
jgi:hypothetical protein